MARTGLRYRDFCKPLARPAPEAYMEVNARSERAPHRVLRMTAGSDVPARKRASPVRITPIKVLGALLLTATSFAGMAIVAEPSAGSKTTVTIPSSIPSMVPEVADSPRGLASSAQQRQGPLDTARPHPVGQTAQTEASIIVPTKRVLATMAAGEKFYGADPALIRDGDVWRVFTTQAYWSTVPTWESTDMVTWTPTADAMPTVPDWARAGQTWAPDVVELESGWVLFFSALYGDSDLHCIGHAVADTALGPYEAFEEPLVCELDEGGSIDPMVHIDGAYRHRQAFLDRNIN
jgi:hypothetical protein